MGSRPTIERHAITPPTFGADKLHRERLVDRILASVPRKLIVITAPAGYGKTTLLADFAAHTELAVCWVGVTDSDRDVARLIAVLQASLARRFRRLRGRPDVAALASYAPQGMARAFIEAIRERVREPFLIAFDDLHLLNDSVPAMTFLDTLIDEIPEHVTVLAAGRELPELSLARLVVDGEMAGIGTYDLAVTPGEAAQLVRTKEANPPDEAAIQRLLDRTQGWITGVLLSGALSGLPEELSMSQAQPQIYEYLGRLYLQEQSEEARTFLRESSVLPVMTAASCREVLQRQESQRMLGTLLRKGMFLTTTDQSPRTYEYHPQFRQFLIEELERHDRERAGVLKRRAAEFLERSGSPDPAFHLYLEAGELDAAAELAESRAAALFEGGRTFTLETWAKRLDGVPAATPSLHLYLATAYLNQGRTDMAEPALRRAFSAMDSLRSTDAMRSRGLSILAWIQLHRGNPRQALSSVRRAERLLKKDDDPIRRATLLRLRARADHAAGEDPGKAEELAERAAGIFETADDRFSLSQTLLDISLYRHAMGDAAGANAANVKAHELMEVVGAPIPLAISYNNLAVSAHMRGEYERALEMFASALQQAHRGGSARHQIVVLYGQADLFSDLGLSYQAAELYSKGLRLAFHLESHELLRYAYLQTSALHRRAGTGQPAEDWLSRALDLEDRPARHPASVLQRAALMIERDPSGARPELIEILSRPLGEVAAQERALARYFLARASYGAGRFAEAQAELAAAVEWASENGAEQPLAAEFLHDAPFRAFAVRSLENDPALSALLVRVEVMEAVAKEYLAPPVSPQRSAPVRFEALGRADIFLNGRRLTDLEPLPRQISFYLMDRRRSQRDDILETFWPEVPLGKQVSSLHTALHSIRQGLGDQFLEIEGTVYRPSEGVDIAYDVSLYESAALAAETMPRGDPRKLFALTEAIHAYGGPFLPEYASDWVLERRRELEERFVELLRLHAEEAVTRALPLRAEESLRRALEIEPLRDDLNSQYLQVLAQLERRSAAVAHYQRYVQLLRSELGLEPPPSIRALYESIIH